MKYLVVYFGKLSTGCTFENHVYVIYKYIKFMEAGFGQTLTSQIKYIHF